MRKKRRNRRERYVRWCVFASGMLAGILIWSRTVSGLTQVGGENRRGNGDATLSVVIGEEPIVTGQWGKHEVLSGENSSDAQWANPEDSLPDNCIPELLVLVNKDNPIAKEYDAKLRKICKGRLEASDYLYEDLCAMLKAAGMEGFDFWIASAYRSVEYQEELIEKDILKYTGQGDSYEQAKAKAYEYKMPPGNSEHHTGLALDILCSTNTKMDITQAEEPGNLWLREHCSEYGFVLRYPEGREDKTGIKYEPWHFRYVGKEAAVYMTNHQLVLEEYVALLNENQALSEK